MLYLQNNAYYINFTSFAHAKHLSLWNSSAARATKISSTLRREANSTTNTLCRVARSPSLTGSICTP